MDIKALDDKLNQAILGGKAMEAFEELYADDVVMQENTEPAVTGKDSNRQREIEFFNSIEAFHGATLLAGAVGGEGVTFGEWEYDVTFKGAGRVTMSQVAVRRWKDGKVASERFYYNKG